MRLPKKTHPHSLPHLSDASSLTDLMKGQLSWAPHVEDGSYQFIVTDEHAIDENTDILVLVRRKVK